MSSSGKADSTESRTVRRYDSPVRREQANRTRERIVAAGAELVRGFDVWDWGDLTFQAVAERAEVGRRTIFRHFPTERDLRGAVMARLAEEAGVDYGRVTLDEVAETAQRVFRAMGTFAAGRRTAQVEDSTLADVDSERREALLRAVTEERSSWTEDDRVKLAAILDVLWSVPAYERLVVEWDMSPDRAREVIAWAIDSLSANATGRTRGRNGRATGS